MTEFFIYMLYVAGGVVVAALTLFAIFFLVIYGVSRIDKGDE